VVVSTSAGYTTDWFNRGPRWCAVVTIGADVTTTCDPLASSSASHSTDRATGRDMMTVALKQSIFTPVGYRDCGEATVHCMFVVERADATSSAVGATPPLPFTGAPTTAATTIDVAATGPTTYTVTPRGLVADPSWLQMRRNDPQRAAGYEPFSVQVCAFGTATPATGPHGTHPWNDNRWPGGLATPNCTSMGVSHSTIDPDHPDLPFTVTAPRELYGYGGWSDCAIKVCFISIRRTTVAAVNANGITGSDTSVTAALLPPSVADAPQAPRPKLTIAEPPPYRAGQTITVELTGLPVDYTTWVGVCHVDGPWACGYVTSTNGTGDHTAKLELPPTVAGCGPETCYLEIDSKGEGLPPFAVADLPIAG